MTHDDDASGSTFPAPNAGGAGGGLKGLYHEIVIEVRTRQSRRLGHFECYLVIISIDVTSDSESKLAAISRGCGRT